MRAAADRPHVVIVGPTASGKSALALALAAHLHATGEVVEIISVDSMQVYRGMDIGTATPGADELAQVRHHVVNCLDPAEECSVSWFQRAALDALADLEARGGRALFVGGTGLYHRAVIDRLQIPGQFPEVFAELDEEPDVSRLHARLVELDPEAAEKMEPTNRRRILRALEVTVGSGRRFSTYGPGMESYPDSPYRMIGLSVARDRLGPLLEDRLARQMSRGFLAEVESLLTSERPLSRTARQALGYRELIDHVEGRLTLQEAINVASVRTRQFGVRQDRWFRRDPRIEWFDAETRPDIATLAGTL